MLFGFSNNANVFELAEAEFPRYTKLVSRGIINELMGISRNRGKKGACARMALMELRAKKIEIDNINEADDWILSRARHGRGYIVVTNDTRLARELSHSGATVLKVSRSGLLKNFK
jgi:rRNA-processing protein FCF1